MVARHPDAGGLDLAAEGQHRDVGGAAADVNDHAAVGHRDVQARPQRRRDGLVDQVDLPRAGRHDGLDHGVALDAGDGRRHADRYPRLDHVGAVYLVDKAADQLPGHGVVADDAVLQGEGGRDVVGGAAHHGPLALLGDDDGGGAKVYPNIVLCHNAVFLSSRSSMPKAPGGAVKIQFSVYHTPGEKYSAFQHDVPAHVRQMGHFLIVQVSGWGGWARLFSSSARPL